MEDDPLRSNTDVHGELAEGLTGNMWLVRLCSLLHH